MANKIPVIDMDTLAAPLDQMWDIGILTLIAPDHVAPGEAVTQKIIERMGGKGKIARTGGQRLGPLGAQGRHQGFKNVVARYPNVEIDDDQPADWSVSALLSFGKPSSSPS